MFYDVQTLVEDFAVLFDFWKEGEAAEGLREPGSEGHDADARSRCRMSLWRSQRR